MSGKVFGGDRYKQIINEIKTRLIRISVFILIISILSMTLSISFIDFHSIQIPILYPNPSDNLSIQIISFMKTTLVPKNVVLIQVSPGQAFFAEINVSIITSFIFSGPLILKEVTSFLLPALYKTERKILRHLLFSSVFLFLAGCSFSFFLVIPYTIDFLYKYGESIGATSFFDIDQFISFTMNFLIIFGVSFQIPLIMLGLSETRVVNIDFWKDNFKYIVIILIIFGAFITPDGSGITMWFVVCPLLFLYLIGLILIKVNSKGNKR
jgi:sec-independent protein translocase protein TatC